LITALNSATTRHVIRSMITCSGVPCFVGLFCSGFCSYGAVGPNRADVGRGGGASRTFPQQSLVGLTNPGFLSLSSHLLIPTDCARRHDVISFYRQDKCNQPCFFPVPPLVDLGSKPSQRGAPIRACGGEGGGA
jgi:hypothetical protein